MIRAITRYFFRSVSTSASFNMSGSSSRFDRSAARSISQQDVDNFDWAAYEGSYKGEQRFPRKAFYNSALDSYQQSSLSSG